MDEKDAVIQEMRKEMARLSNRLVEVVGEACVMCLKYTQIQNCIECRIHKIKEDLMSNGF